VSRKVLYQRRDPLGGEPGTNTRWGNKLNPEISKEKWTEKDGEKLFELHGKFGPAWKTLASHFEGRSDNFLKNQFFSLLRRSLRRINRYLNVPKGGCYSH
jgi:hypothetical protein